MPVVIKIDGSRIEPLEDHILELAIKIRKGDDDIQAGTSAFIWSHYSQPRKMDGQLICLGVVTRAIRSEDKKSVDLRVAISPCPPLRVWRTAELDILKNRNDDSPETQIANEIRGYTHEHVGHVSDDAAAVMASYFI